EEHRGGLVVIALPPRDGATGGATRRGQGVVPGRRRIRPRPGRSPVRAVRGTGRTGAGRPVGRWLAGGRRAHRVGAVETGPRRAVAGRVRGGLRAHLRRDRRGDGPPG